MAKVSKKPWDKDSDLAAIAAVPLTGPITTGEAVSSWVWDLSYRSCLRMRDSLRDSIDLEANPRSVLIQRLWLCILDDRIATGDRR